MQRPSFLTTLNDKEILVWKTGSYWGQGKETEDRRSQRREHGLSVRVAVAAIHALHSQCGELGRYWTCSP